SGHSRGVMLTHGNLVAIIPHNYFNLCPADSYLNLLPLAHIFPLQIALFTLSHGVRQIYLHDLTRISEVCMEYHPTGMIVVPRILEKVLEKMKERLETLEGWRKKLGVWALDLAFRPRSMVRMLLRPFADFFVYRKLRQGLGGKMRVIINGGATLNPSLQRALNSMGFPIFQGWGLTEASTVTVNRFGNNKEGTVGKPYPGTVIKISTHGEVLVRGPTVMKGYYKDPVATAEAIDEKGWLHTGDIGSIDRRGRLKIIGRLSDSFKNSRGQYIIPSPIEEKLRSYPLIDYTLITGENEPFVTALLFPSVAELDKLRGDMSPEEFLKSPLFQREVDQIIREVNTTLDEWERIRDYRFILEPPTLANGELTPTLKLRRQLVLGKHKGLISSLYQSAH
ncbi:MAG: AMP-binding protein, partial [Chlamydiia bacterium]|nr:AMP-binding protein [Chlamydiia bacterium]